MGRLKLSVRYISLLRWAGAKKWLIPRIQTDSLGCFRYVEPFLGSGIVLLNMDPNLVCIGGDENQDLIEALISIRDEPANVVEHISRMRNHKDEYLSIRQLDRQPNFSSLARDFRAARFVYLNHTCFNGLYRVNSRGEFNVPFGNRNVELSDVVARIHATSARLREKLLIAGSENLIRGDFHRLLDNAKRGDFYYLDPPYSELSTRSSFTGYTAARFSKGNHFSLLDWMAHARESGVRVLLSNSYRESLVSYAKALDLQVEKHVIRRSIAASANKRGNAEEVLIANY